MARRGGSGRYEAVEDLAGRLGSYAGLVSRRRQASIAAILPNSTGRTFPSGWTNASVHLLFLFALELNRVGRCGHRTRDADA